MQASLGPAWQSVDRCVTQQEDAVSCKSADMGTEEELETRGGLGDDECKCATVGCIECRAPLGGRAGNHTVRSSMDRHMDRHRGYCDTGSCNDNAPRRLGSRRPGGVAHDAGKQKSRSARDASSYTNVPLVLPPPPRRCNARATTQRPWP